MGIFGGTFDPIHYGHLIIAQTVMEHASLDRVLFVPAGIPPHKARQRFSPPEIRFALVENAIADNPAFRASDVEIRRQGPSYMVDTLRQLRALHEYADAELFLVLGADNLPQFHKWHHPDDILAMVRLLIYPRYDAKLEDAAQHVLDACQFIQAPRIEISSSYIRQRVAQGRSIAYFVPPPVAHYIMEKKLYLPN